MSEPKIINSVSRALTILDTFTEQDPLLTLHQIAQKTGLPKATAYRLLHTLLKRNFISSDIDNKYFLGPKVITLGFSVLQSMEMREIALPYMKDLSKITKQNVNLGILDQMEAIYIERVEKRQIVRLNLHIGSRLNLHQTAMGRAIIAFLESGKFHDILNNLLKDRQVLKDIGPKGKKLLAILQDVRAKGFAICDEESILGVRAIAAPIFDGYERVVAAINLTVFSGQVSLEKLITLYAPMLLKTAEKISANLGYKNRQ